MPFTESAAKRAAEIQVFLEQKGQMIQSEDTMIAACALVRGEKVVTRDSGYTRIPGLVVLKY